MTEEMWMMDEHKPATAIEMESPQRSIAYVLSCEDL
jgi:hypothetical protein